MPLQYMREKTFAVLVHTVEFKNVSVCKAQQAIMSSMSSSGENIPTAFHSTLDPVPERNGLGDMIIFFNGLA